MQAIKTKFIGPTNTKGSRVKASCHRGSITIEWRHELNGDERHRAAVIALISKFVNEDEKLYGTPPKGNPWNRPFITGEIEGGELVHVFNPVNSYTVLIQCQDEEDAREIERYVQRCRSSEGTVTGLHAGVACSALKRTQPDVS